MDESRLRFRYANARPAPIDRPAPPPAGYSPQQRNTLTMMRRAAAALAARYHGSRLYRLAVALEGRAAAAEEYGHQAAALSASR